MPVGRLLCLLLSLHLCIFVVIYDFLNLIYSNTKQYQTTPSNTVHISVIGLLRNIEWGKIG